MTDEIRPERLDELFDGAAADTDEERELLALAAELRASAPPAPDHLRQRIADLGEPPVARRASGGWWSRIRWRMAAPALAGLIAVLVAVTVIPQVIGGSDDDVSLSDAPGAVERETAVPERDSAASVPQGEDTGGSGPGMQAREPSASSSAPRPVDGVVREGDLDRVRDAVSRAIADAGGRVTSQTGEGTVRTVESDVTGADTAHLVDGLMAIDGVSFTRSELDAAVSAGPGLRIDLRTR